MPSKIRTAFEVLTIDRDHSLLFIHTNGDWYYHLTRLNKPNSDLWRRTAHYYPSNVAKYCPYTFKRKDLHGREVNVGEVSPLGECKIE